MKKNQAHPNAQARAAADRAAIRNLPSMSETIVAFAKPLTSTLPTPPSESELRNVMHLAMVAWNLPLYEKRQHAQAAALRATWEALLSTVPAGFGALLKALVETRTGTLASDPRTAMVDVVAAEDGRAQVTATGTLLEESGG